MKGDDFLGDSRGNFIDILVNNLHLLSLFIVYCLFCKWKCVHVGLFISLSCCLGYHFSRGKMKPWLVYFVDTLILLLVMLQLIRNVPTWVTRILWALHIIHCRLKIEPKLTRFQKGLQKRLNDQNSGFTHVYVYKINHTILQNYPKLKSDVNLKHISVSAYKTIFQIFPIYTFRLFSQNHCMRKNSCIFWLWARLRIIWSYFHIWSISNHTCHQSSKECKRI